MLEVKVTKDNFEAEVLKSDVPVLLDFWAEWCGPCRMLGPVLAEIAEEKQGVIKVGKVNVDEEIELAHEFSVSAIPTVLCFDGGEVVNKSVGFCSKEELLELVPTV